MFQVSIDITEHEHVPSQMVQHLFRSGEEKPPALFWTNNFPD
jgi:hypothetical protein